MSQAVQEPEGGIDNTLAAAFAQVRQQIEETEAARGTSESEDDEEAAQAEPTSAAEAADAVAEAPSAEVVAEAPAAADAEVETQAIAEPAVEDVRR